jgi:hypothetical protein
MFKEKVVYLAVGLLVSPLVLCEKVLIASGKGPKEYELKKFLQIEKFIDK